MEAQLENEDAQRIEQIISSQSYKLNNSDLFFLIDYLLGFQYIHNQMQQYKGDSSIIQNLISHMNIQNVLKGDIIYQKGQRNQNVYFIVEGKVSSWKEKTKEETDYERNMFNQIIRLQKSIEMEKTLKKDQKQSDLNSMIHTWEIQMLILKKQLSIVQKEDYRLSSTFKSEEEGISSLSFLKIYKSKVDLLGYQNTLYNTRPENTLIAETDCKFLVVKGEDFYDTFKKEIENVHFLLNVMYSQFSTVDRTILQIMSQQFASFFYSMNQEIYSLNPSAEQQISLGEQQQKGQGKQSHANRSGDNQIAFYIIKGGTVLVKEVCNQQNYNICQLSDGSIIGIEKMSSTYKNDFSNTNVTFICISDRLQLLGITKKAIDEVLHTHHNYVLQKILSELGNQRSSFFLNRLENIKSSLIPFSNHSDLMPNQQVEKVNNSPLKSEFQQTHIELKSDSVKHGFLKKKQSICEEENLMIKACQKNKKQQITFNNVELCYEKQSLHMKSLVNSILLFRPSKLNSDQIQEKSTLHSIHRHRRAKQESDNIKIQNTLIVNDETEMSFNHQKSQTLQSRSFITNQTQSHYQKNEKQQQRQNQYTLFRPQVTKEQNNHQKIINNGKNQKTETKEKSNGEIELSNQAGRKYKINQQKITNSHRFLRTNTKHNINSNQSQKEEESFDEINYLSETKGEKMYEQYYRQDFYSSEEEGGQVKNVNELIKTNQKRVTNKSKEEIEREQNRSHEENKEGEQSRQVHMLQDGHLFKRNKPNASLQTNNLTQYSDNSPQQSNTSPHNSKSVPQKIRNKQQSIPKNNLETANQNCSEQEIRNEQSTLKRIHSKRNLYQKSLDQVSTSGQKLNQSSSSQKRIQNQKNNQKTNKTSDEQIAIDLQINEDFELKNGKLFQKKAPTFSELREDFITSNNPYKQCADIIEKFQMISESNKSYLEKNTKDYKKEVENKVEEQKRIVRLLKNPQKNDFIEDNIKNSRLFKRKDTQILIYDIENMNSSPIVNQNQDLSYSQIFCNTVESMRNQNQEISRPSSSLKRHYSQQDTLSLSIKSSINQSEEKTEEENKFKQITQNQQGNKLYHNHNPSRFNDSVKSSFNENGALQKYILSSTFYQSKNAPQKSNIDNNSQTVLLIKGLCPNTVQYTSRPNSSYQNRSHISTLQQNLSINLVMLQNCQHSFQPSNSQVQMMPVFEPKLPMSGINRPKTARINASTLNFSKINNQTYNNNGQNNKLVKKQKLLNFVQQSNFLIQNSKIQQNNFIQNQSKIVSHIK